MADDLNVLGARARDVLAAKGPRKTCRPAPATTFP
jgi:hypothetical protein